MIGKGKGEKKACRSNFVSGIMASLASLSGPYFVIGSYIGSCVGRYPQALWMAAAASSCGSCDVRYLHIRLRLLFPQVRLLFDRGKW